jgi:hypothetical protein
VHWSLTVPFVSVVTIAFALVSYDLVVRSTFAGAILNGRRRDRVLLPWVLGRLGRTSSLKLAPGPRKGA